MPSTIATAAKRLGALFATAGLMALGGGDRASAQAPVAQTPATQAPVTDSEKEIERYRAMISDPMSNPGFLNVDRGEVLWKLKRGAKSVGLEGCDLGEGAGKLEGAYAKLPRHFKDADRAMDLEQRLQWCMVRTSSYMTGDSLTPFTQAPELPDSDSIPNPPIG